MSAQMGKGGPAHEATTSGTATFLFTDIELSTQLARQLGGERYRAVLERHRAVVRAFIAAYDGREIGTEGDSFFVVFGSAANAVAAAAEAQRALAATEWPGGATLRVRMGLHSGEATVAAAGAASDFVGYDVHKA
ncbi:MAG: adenylate/guanylate cyclase domain-containing protein, partial [Candidatus Limnocylindria bacterium]